MTQDGILPELDLSAEAHPRVAKAPDSRWMSRLRNVIRRCGYSFLDADHAEPGRRLRLSSSDGGRKITLEEMRDRRWRCWIDHGSDTWTGWRGGPSCRTWKVRMSTVLRDDDGRTFMSMEVALNALRAYLVDNPTGSAVASAPSASSTLRSAPVPAKAAAPSPS